MKYILILILIIFYSCKQEPDLYINGKPYIINRICIKDHIETKWSYHYGYWMGKFKWHYGPKTTHFCDEYKVDTLELK